MLFCWYHCTQWPEKNTRIFFCFVLFWGRERRKNYETRYDATFTIRNKRLTTDSQLSASLLSIDPSPLFHFNQSEFKETPNLLTRPQQVAISLRSYRYDFQWKALWRWVISTNRGFLVVLRYCFASFHISFTSRWCVKRNAFGAVVNRVYDYWRVWENFIFLKNKNWNYEQRMSYDK